MEIDDRISGIEIEYRYPECKGRAERTLRIFVEGELKSDLARELMKNVHSYFADSENFYDHISVVGVARDWTAERADATERTKELFSRLFPDLYGARTVSG